MSAQDPNKPLRQTTQGYRGYRPFGKNKLFASETVDIKKRLIVLKARRQAVKHAIDALLRLKAPWRSGQNPPRP
jgi:hypothetical protein